MSRALADTVYWVARINPRDQWHSIYRAVGGVQLVTSDEVVDEVLAHFSAFGPAMRTRAVAIVRHILAQPDVGAVHHWLALGPGFEMGGRGSRRAPRMARREPRPPGSDLGPCAIRT